jgi:FKBP-type peptidyl-prolyl cis-trans isomerase FklB
MEVTPAIADSLSMAYAVLNANTLVKSLNQDRQFEPASIKAFLKSIQETAKITNSKDMAEVVGVSIGLQIKEQIFPMIEQEFFADSTDFNRDNFFAAFFASMKGEDLLLDEMEAGAILRREGQKMLDQRMEEEFGENKAAGIAFLEENKKQEGVKETASGLQYLVLKEGNGANPTATSVVKVHYHGSLIDGTVFDSSVNRGTPAEFPLNQVIAGWTEGLQLMNKGAKYRFFIPQELGYGGQDRGVIKPFSVLIFDVELLDIVK